MPLIPNNKVKATQKSYFILNNSKQLSDLKTKKITIINKTQNEIDFEV